MDHGYQLELVNYKIVELSNLLDKIGGSFPFLRECTPN